MTGDSILIMGRAVQIAKYAFERQAIAIQIFQVRFILHSRLITYGCRWTVHNGKGRPSLLSWYSANQPRNPPRIPWVYLQAQSNLTRR